MARSLFGGETAASFAKTRPVTSRVPTISVLETNVDKKSKSKSGRRGVSRGNDYAVQQFFIF